ATFALELPTSLIAQRRGAVALVMISRPAKRNALDDAIVEGLDLFFSSLPDDVKAVVLHGEGDHFSAGLDLSNLAEASVTEGIAHSRLWHRAFERLQFGKAPVVAVLHGAVIGGGLELAAGIAGNAPMTNYAVMHVLPRIAEADPAAGYMTEALISAIAQGEEEAKARLRDFLEKRGPKAVQR